MSALARPFLALREALSVSEDYWTWRTLQDDVYEDVTVAKVSRHSVTIEHKYGRVTIPRADLAPELQSRLVESCEMSESVVVGGALSEAGNFMGSMPMAHAK